MTVIKSEISGKHVTKGDCKQKVGHSFIAEQFKADQERGDRAVRDTTEYCGHAYGRT